MYVWVVTFDDEPIVPKVFGSAEKAYNYMEEEAISLMTFDFWEEEVINNCLNELKNKFKSNENEFSVEIPNGKIFCDKLMVE